MKEGGTSMVGRPNHAQLLTEDLDQLTEVPSPITRPNEGPTTGIISGVVDDWPGAGMARRAVHSLRAARAASMPAVAVR
jgi:hypothetical protein